MKTRTKWIFYLILTLPFFWLMYLGTTNDLGANPAEEFNLKLGNITIIILLVNLYWGCFEALINNRILKPWYPLRRPLGVAAAVYAVLHFASYFAREGDVQVALEQLTSKTYLIFGFISLLLLLLLAITSNNFSVRHLKAKRWKALHRLVYVAFLFITIHVLSIEKKSWLVNVWTIFPMLAVFFYRFCHWQYCRIREQFRKPA